MKVTHKHTETWMINFGDHRCLSQSEESKCNPIEGTTSAPTRIPNWHQLVMAWQ